jgi:hypothetical protein
MTKEYKLLKTKVPKKIYSEFKTLCKIKKQNIDDKIINLMESEVYSAEIDNF